MTWWNNSWGFKQKLTLDTNGITIGSNITGDHVIMVKIDSTNSDFWNNAETDGKDVRFTNAAEDTLLEYHFEQFNHTTDDMVAWIHVTDTFPSGSDLELYMYYGNPGASDAQDESATYPSTYTAAYHMNDSGSPMLDSTAGNFDLTNVNTPTLQITGQIDKGIKYERATAEGSINGTLLDAGFSKLSVALWVLKPVQWDSGATTQQGIFLKANTGTNEDRISAVWRADGSIQWAVLQGVTADVLASSKVSWAANTWFHLVFVFDSDANEMKIYVNGGIGDGGTRSDAMAVVAAGTNTDFFVGDVVPFADNEPDESIDEFKVFRNVALTADEVKLIYNSEVDNLIAFGSQEVIPGEAVMNMRKYW